MVQPTIGAEERIELLPVQNSIFLLPTRPEPVHSLNLQLNHAVSGASPFETERPIRAGGVRYGRTQQVSTLLISRENRAIETLSNKTFPKWKPGLYSVPCNSIHIPKEPAWNPCPRMIWDIFSSWWEQSRSSPSSWSSPSSLSS